MSSFDNMKPSVYTKSTQFLLAITDKVQACKTTIVNKKSNKMYQH